MKDQFWLDSKARPVWGMDLSGMEESGMGVSGLGGSFSSAPAIIEMLILDELNRKI